MRPPLPFPSAPPSPGQPSPAPPRPAQPLLSEPLARPTSAFVPGHSDRNNLRDQCRNGLRTEYGYDVLVNGAAIYSNYTGPAPAQCGYTGLPVRKDSAALPEIQWYLKSCIGACQEYNDLTTTSLPVGTPFLFVDVDRSHFCADGSSAIFWVSTLTTILFLLYLVRLRRVTQQAAENDDRERLTTADYALRFTGLEVGADADALHERLLVDLERLGIPRDSIDSIEVSRRCNEELTVMKELCRLRGMRDELDARKVSQEKRYTSTELADTKLAKVASRFETAKSTIRHLLLEPDLSTGQAFVVFKLETERNRCAKIFAVNRGMAGESGGVAFDRIEVRSPRVAAAPPSPPRPP